LRSIAGEALAPWVKIGNVLFRATTIAHNGHEISLTAGIRDNTVANAIEAMRPSSAYGRNSDPRITWPTGTAAVRVTNVTSTTTSALNRDVTITATVLPNNGNSSPMRVAVNGHSPDELTEIALRSALFGEPNPLGTMALLAQATNPLPALNGLGLSEDAVGQVARLLVTEELVGRLHAGHITQFELSPARGGARRIRLGWMPDRIYDNVAPQPRFIEGEVPVV
jgi:hypothetical protein